MAGRPMRKMILAHVNKNGGSAWLEEYVGSGGTVVSLARELDVTRGYLSSFLNGIPEMKAALNAGRVESADAHVEDALEIADGLGGSSSKEEISAAREQIGIRKFMAASYKQDRYGNKPGAVNVQINMSDLHLDALRKVNSDLKALRDEDDARTIEHE